MPFPATSETCYVAPPTSVPTFPPTPSLAPAAFPRPFPSLLECFLSFRRVLFTLESLPAAVTSTWTRHPLLPGLLPPPCSPHQSLPPSHGAAALRRLLQTLPVAKTCPCSTFGAWLSGGFAAGSVLGARVIWVQSRVYPLLRQAC